ncbi:MAG: PSD1 and planctomycete cytochrome C domain-containing protein [Chthoniobacteraceae bacterium]
MPLRRPLIFLAAFLLTALARAELRQLTYERDIRPILKHHCFQCHGEGEKLKAGLDVRLRRLLVEPHGSDGAVAIVPGKPEESELINLVREGEMPQKGRKLSAAEIATLEQWVAQGAKTARPEPAEVPAVWVSEEDREWWAFQPIKRPPVPSIGNPIDSFLLAKLKAQGLAFNPEADKPTLLRRVMLDLTGLPPTPEETAIFLADEAPDAYARMVERVLASPHYGERWGRHWLDVAGYSDSDGYSETDPARPWAFKFRDYVIRSLNADKPFDQFIREQLAGDEMVKQPFKNLPPDDIDKLTATAFLRMVPDGTASATADDQPTARNAVMAETIKVVSSSLLGITVGCAQCHEHKHDPVPQQDYYRMRAIFAPALDVEKWRVPGARLVSLMTEEERAKAAEVEKEAKVIDAERKVKEDEFIGKVLTWELEAKPEEVREPLRTAYRTDVKKRTPEQLKLLKDHPTINQLSASSLYLYDRTYKTKHEAELKAFTEKATGIRKRKPVEQFIPVLSEVPAAPLPATHLFLRGMIDQPREKIGPGELTVLAAFRPSPIPEKSPSLPTSGRRLALAQSLTDGKHPLTTRVLVNRVWHHHFGRGIVASLGDFGHLGDRPSHPELLDWLASEFVAQGWSLKALHRVILNSTTYRQSSARTGEKDRLDPDNRLLGRMNSRRLEAETIRDAMLRVSGKFNPRMFGAPVPVMLDETGQVVVGVNTNDTAGRPSGKFVALNGEEFRRSLYVQMRRSQPLGMLETFDLPRMEPNCEIRNASTVAPQSLAMMNSEFTLTQSKYFAERVVREAGADSAAQVQRAWQLAFGVEPAASDVKDAVAFVAKQTATLKAHPVKLAAPAKGKEPAPADPAMQSLATFCQALLTSNQFLYVD